MNNKLMGRYEARAYTAFMAIGSALIIIFAITWFHPNNIATPFSGVLGFLNILLFLLTTYVVWHEIIMGSHVGSLLIKMKKWRLLPPQKNLKVAFITTFVPGKEPHSMLKHNLQSLVNAHYTHDTWLLDEGNDSQAKNICKQLGVKYFTRYGIKKYNTSDGNFTAKTKGGNHNAWHHAHGHAYDIVAQVDLDFIVKKNFLTETLGQFRDPKIAFVGTPQYYGNYNQGIIAKGAAEQSFSFYGPVQRGLAGANMPMLIGANHVIRVKALQSVGGYAGHITEDLLTGMLLYARGWKAAYCPKILAIGEGPTTWESYFAQQMRWAHGCFDVLFRHSVKLLIKMPFMQKIRYGILLQHYFSGLTIVLGSLLLIAYFFLGIRTANYSLELALLVYLPILVWLLVLPLWHHRFNINPKKEKGIMAAGKLIILAVQPVYFMALIGALRNKKIEFVVTPKGQQPKGWATWRVFWPHIALGGVSASALVYGVVSGRLSHILVFWAAANSVIALLFIAIILASKLRKRTKLTPAPASPVTT